MEHERIHDRNKLRVLLHDSEQNRSDWQRRELFWQAGKQWQRCFEQLVQRENDSDAQFQHEIEETRLGSETQAQLESEWYSQVCGDVTWYEQFLALLQNTDNEWQNTRGITKHSQQELYDHIGQLTQRRLERHIILCQLNIEVLERRRYQSGAINEHHWRQQWEKLRSAFINQDAVYSNAVPSSIIEQRLAWAQRVHHLQHESEQFWRHSNGDWRGLRADMATISHVIDGLRFQPAGSGGSGMVGVLVVIAVMIGIAAAIYNSNPASPTMQDVAISGTAQATTAVPPLIQAATAPQGDQQQLNKQGVDLLKQGRCEDAIQQFRAAIEADPSAYAAYEPLNNMAFCLYDLGQQEDAITNWQAALVIEQNSPDANAGLGFVLFERGQQEEGLALYRRAIGIQPRYADEVYLRDEVFWSANAIEASRPLRVRLGE